MATKKIRLTESELTNLIRRIVEDTENMMDMEPEMSKNEVLELISDFFKDEVLPELSPRETRSLKQKLERPPSAEELAELLDVSVNDVKQSLQSNGRHLSMDAPLTEGDESSSSLYDVLPNDYMDTPDKSLVQESLRKDIERSLSTLTSREGEVVRLYFGLNGRYPLTLEEIGDQFDLTRERVRQIKEKAIRRMKHTSRSKMLKNYLS